jgi:hypothetical protein
MLGPQSLLIPPTCTASTLGHASRACPARFATYAGPLKPPTISRQPGEERTSSGEVTRFSTASTTPSSVRTAIAVEPSCKGQGGPEARVRQGNPWLSGLHRRRKHRGPPAPRTALLLRPTPHLNGLDRILYLEQPALGAAQQVAGSVRGRPLKSSPPVGGPDRVQAAECPAQVLT